MKYKVIYDREGCIGAFACVAAAPEFWKFNEDGKADLELAQFNLETKKWELEIDETQLREHEAARDVCPVHIISIEKIE